MHTVGYQVFGLSQWMSHLRWLGGKGGYVGDLSKASKVLIKNNLINVWGQQEHKESPGSGVPTSALTCGTRPLHRSLLCNSAHTRGFHLPLHQDTDITALYLYAAWRLTRVSAYTARLSEVVWQPFKTTWTQNNQLESSIANHTVAGIWVATESHNQFTLWAFDVLDKTVELEVKKMPQITNSESESLFLKFLRHSALNGFNPFRSEKPGQNY